MIHLTAAKASIRAGDFPCDIIGCSCNEDDLLAEPLQLTAGSLGSLKRAGIGVELDDAKVKRY